MKAITILQPWASLIACGAKKIETRGWATKYRGPIAIHAGKRWPAIVTDKTQRLPESIHLALCWKGGYSRLADLPMGAVIAIADLVDCVQIKYQYCDRIVTPTDCKAKPFKAILSNGQEVKGNELTFGDYTPDRYAWILANVRQIEPIAAKGQQRLWEWDGDKNE